MFMCLVVFETIKVLYQTAHIEHKNIIYKQHFEWSKIRKRAFEFKKQIIAIKIKLLIVLNLVTNLNFGMYYPLNLPESLFDYLLQVSLSKFLLRYSLWVSVQAESWEKINHDPPKLEILILLVISVPEILLSNQTFVWITFTSN